MVNHFQYVPKKKINSKRTNFHLKVAGDGARLPWSEAPGSGAIPVLLQKRFQILIEKKIEMDVTETRFVGVLVMIVPPG